MNMYSTSILYFVICLLIDNVISFTNKKSISFLNFQFHIKEWTHIQTVVDHWTKHGKWETYRYAKNWPYVSPCISDEIRYGWNECRMDNRTRYHWKSTPYYNDVSETSPHLKYHYKHFSTHEMCNFIQDRAIMIVGDSISEEFYFTFLSTMHYDKVCSPSGQIQTHCNISISNSFESSEKLVNYQISGIRNVYLSLTPTCQDVQVCQNWIERLHPENVSLLIMNRGTHYSDSDDDLINELRKTFTYLNENYPNISIVYRNTPSGHDLLETFQQHVFDLPLTMKPDYNSLNFTNPNWHYQDFERQNHLVEEMIKTEFPYILHLDVFTSTVLRRDSHVDPLHYCIPGPIDNWMSILYNALNLISQYRD